MEPPAPKKAKLGAGGASKPSNKASKPKAIRGAAAEAAGEAAVRDYLERFQRPCNCTQLWENTRKIVSKSNIQLALNRLVAAGIVAEKQYQNGKVSLYYADPDAMAQRVDAPTPDELCDILFDDVPRILVETEATRAKALKLERRAAALAKEPTNAELDEALRTAVTAAAVARPSVLRLWARGLWLFCAFLPVLLLAPLAAASKWLREESRARGALEQLVRIPGCYQMHFRHTLRSRALRRLEEALHRCLWSAVTAAVVPPLTVPRR